MICPSLLVFLLPFFTSLICTADPTLMCTRWKVEKWIATFGLLPIGNGTSRGFSSLHSSRVIYANNVMRFFSGTLKNGVVANWLVVFGFNFPCDTDDLGFGFGTFTGCDLMRMSV